MAGMLMLWIALGAIAGLGVKAAGFPHGAPTYADSAGTGAAGAFTTGAFFAGATGRTDWFDPLATAIAIVGAAMVVIFLRRIAGPASLRNPREDERHPRKPRWRSKGPISWQALVLLNQSTISSRRRDSRSDTAVSRRGAARFRPGRNPRRRVNSGPVN